MPPPVRAGADQPTRTPCRTVRIAGCRGAVSGTGEDTRTDVELIGFDKVLKEIPDQNVYYMSGHGSYIDALVTILSIGEQTAVRPVMTESMTRGRAGKVLKSLLAEVNGFLFADPAVGGKTAYGHDRAIVREMGNSRRRNQPTIIWPMAHDSRNAAGAKTSASPRYQMS